MHTIECHCRCDLMHEMHADPDIGQRAFGARGSIAIAVLLYAELFLT